MPFGVLYAGDRMRRALLNALFYSDALVLCSETGRTGGTNMYAVIKTGGKQYKVSVDDEIFVEKLEGEAGSQVTFEDVLAVSDDNGIVAGDVKATVTGEIVKIVSKYKAKKGYRRKNGHRQPYTRVLIKAINA